MLKDIASSRNPQDMIAFLEFVQKRSLRGDDDPVKMGMEKIIEACRQEENLARCNDHSFMLTEEFCRRKKALLDDMEKDGLLVEKSFSAISTCRMKDIAAYCMDCVHDYACQTYYPYLFEYEFKQDVKTFYGISHKIDTALAETGFFFRMGEKKHWMDGLAYSIEEIHHLYEKTRITNYDEHFYWIASNDKKIKSSDELDKELISDLFEKIHEYEKGSTMEKLYFAACSMLMGVSRKSILSDKKLNFQVLHYARNTSFDREWDSPFEAFARKLESASVHEDWEKLDVAPFMFSMFDTVHKSDGSKEYNFDVKGKLMGIFRGYIFEKMEGNIKSLTESAVEKETSLKAR